MISGTMAPFTPIADPMISLLSGMRLASRITKGMDLKRLTTLSNI